MLDIFYKSTWLLSGLSCGSCCSYNLWESPLQAWSLWDGTAFLEPPCFWDVAAVTLCWSSIHLHWTQSNAGQIPKRNFKMIDLLLNQERAVLLRFKEYQRSCVTRHIVEQKQWSLQITGMSGLRDHLSLVAGPDIVYSYLSQTRYLALWIHPNGSTSWCGVVVQ